MTQQPQEPIKPTTTRQEEAAEIERILTAMPETQRRCIERFFGFITEASIEVEIQRASERNLFGSVAEYEKALQATGQSARSLAVAEILGH